MTELKDKDEQYKKFLEYGDSEEVKRKRLFIFARCVIIAFILIICTVFITYMYNNFDGIKKALNFVTGNTNETDTAQINKSKKFNLKGLNRYQNILLVGVDSNGPDTNPFEGVRSDTLILLNVDIKGRGVNAISIPRDSKVYIARNHGIQKINAAFAIGGIDLTKETLEETLGITIDNYIIVNSAGVGELVNALGGVPIYIENNMFYHDYSAKLHINLQKGAHVLTGDEAIGYLRFRHDMLGDIGRTYRQQAFLKALMERIKSPDAIKNIPEALKVATTYTKTDMNLYQMSQYAALAREIDLNKITVQTLPGAPNQKGYISYWILDADKTQQLVNELIYHKKPNVSDLKLTAGIIYSFDREVEAMKIKQELRNQGYEVNCVDRAQLDETKIIGHNQSVSNEFINYLRKRVPEIKSYPFLYDPVRTYCANSDFTIVVSNH